MKTLTVLAIGGFKKGVEGLFVILTVWGILLSVAASIFAVWTGLSWTFSKIFRGKEKEDTTPYTISDPAPGPVANEQAA